MGENAGIMERLQGYARRVLQKGFRLKLLVRSPDGRYLTNCKQRHLRCQFLFFKDPTSDRRADRMLGACCWVIIYTQLSTTLLLCIDHLY